MAQGDYLLTKETRRTAAHANLAGQSSERLLALDFVRGFAVLGILAANIIAFALPSVEQGWPSAFGPLSPESSAVWLTDFLLVDGKMRSLFAILFGASLALLIEQADRRGEFGIALQMRRLFWLALFGAAHFLLLFRGDILFAYALWGLFAMFMVRLPSKLLIILGVTLYLAMVPLVASVYAPFLAQPIPANGELVPPGLDPDLLREDGIRDEAIMREGSFGETMFYRAERHGYAWFSSALDGIRDSFPMMLIGIALFRLGLFSRGPGSFKLFASGVGLSIGAILLGLWLARAPMQSGFELVDLRYFAYALAPLQRLPMTLGWIFLLVALLPIIGRGLGTWVSAAGRMAFSNYIGTSLVMGLIFQGWGLGLFGEYDRLQLSGFVLLGWALMLAWSRPWLERFRYGPLEWLWRCLVQWQWLPFRK